MKIIHIFLVEKFTDGFVEFVNQNFELEQHDFLIYGKNYLKLNCLKEKNVMYRRDLALFLSKQENIEKLLAYDKIIIHGLFDASIIDKWFLNFRLLKKTYLYLWGGDFYPEDVGKYDYSKIKRSFIIRHAAAVINILPIENQIVKKLYHVKGKQYYATYYNEKEMTYYYNWNADDNTDQNVVKIQIGNSATETNHHKEVLNLLYKFRNEDILIYAPLSYGEVNYAKEIEQYGKSLFKEKFIALNDFMGKKQYYDFMSNMDIAIFDISRQQALGNIYAHLIYRNILYLRKKSVGTLYFKKNLGCTIRSVEEIEKLDFNQFCYQKKSVRETNAKKMLNRLKKEQVISEWQRIFNS